MLREVRRNYKRLVAFMLTVAMTLTNVLTNLNVAFAADDLSSALFLVDGTELRDAIQEAKEDGEAFDYDSLELEASSKTLANTYKKLLGGADGTVYELDVDVDDAYAPEGTALALYYNAGTDDVIFLFINDSDEPIIFRANVDGYETARVTVAAGTSDLADGDAADPGAGTDQPAGPDDAVTDGAVGGGSGGSGGGGGGGSTTTDDVTGDTTTGDVAGDATGDTAGDASGDTAGDASGDTAGDASGDTAGDANDTTTGGGENTANPEGSADEGDNTNTDNTTGDTAGDSTGTGSAEGDTTGGDAAGSDNAGGDTAGDNAGSGDAGSSDTSDQGGSSDSGASDSGSSDSGSSDSGSSDSGSSDSGSSDSGSSDSGSSDSGSSDSGSSDSGSSDSGSSDSGSSDSGSSDSGSSDSGSSDSGSSDSGSSDGGTTVGLSIHNVYRVATSVEEELLDDVNLASDSNAEENTEDGSEDNQGSETGDTGNNGNINDNTDGTITEDTQDNIIKNEDEQLLEDDTIYVYGELKGKSYNDVTIWETARARAFRVSVEDLTGMVVDGYTVDYSVDPVGAATIKGKTVVADGEDLYFAVEPQVGYEITSVTANGAELEAVDAADIASASDLARYAYVYVAEAVDEDLEIVASLEETDNHPELHASYTASDGVKISLHAEEGILPEGTELQVIEITNNSLKEAFKEKVTESAAEDDSAKQVTDVVLYDINLLLNGEKLDNSWSSNGYVDVTFSGSKISSMTKSADQVEIYAVDDSKVEKLTADNAAVAESETLELESVGSEDVTDTSVSSLSYQAEHFTIMGIATLAASDVDYVVTVGSTETIDGSSGLNHKWTSDKTRIATVSGYSYSSNATVTGVAAGEVRITHKYTPLFETEQTEYFTIKVVKAQPSITISPSTTKLTQKNQTVNLRYTLKNMAQDSIVEWRSSDELVATVNGGVVTAVGDGTATITATAHPDDDELWGQTYSATATINVEFDKYNLYHYALIPGKSDIGQGPGTADKNWFGIGVTKIKGVPNPQNLTEGIHPELSYEIGEEIKSLYPRITFEGTTYTYAESGSENALKQGYYTLNPYRLVVSAGANAGNNNYNDTVNSAIRTYHLDYTISLNERDYRTVTFNVLYPEADEFASLTDFVQRVQDGTGESALTKPSGAVVSPTQTYNGINYRFDGWYTNQDCTIRASFNGEINSNKAYYAKYVPTNQRYTVEYYYDDVIDSAMTETLGPVSIGDEITSYPTDGKVKTGYTFSRATVGLGNPLTIGADASKNVIRVYYTKRNVPYSINYYWNGTTNKVRTSVTERAQYGAEITGHLEDVTGYTAVDPDVNEKTIILSDSQTEINFYYYKNVEITANSKEVTYNGTAQTVSGYTGAPSGVTFTAVSVSARGTNAGTYEAKFGEDVVGTVDSSEKYIITGATDGNLTITKRPLKLTGAGWTEAQPYTGSTYTKDSYDVEEFSSATKRGIVAGHEVIGLTYSISGTNAGEHKGAFTGTAAIKAGAKDVTANYEIEQEAGNLKIVASAVGTNITLTTKDVEKVYDGTALSAGQATAVDKNGSSVKVEYSVDGEVWTEDYASITATAVADSKTIQVRASGANYIGHVTAEQGLKITPRPITITARDASKYVGNPDPEAFVADIITGEVVTGEKLDYNVVRSNAGTEDPGVYKKVIEIVLSDNSETNANYDITVVPANFTIWQDAMAVEKTITNLPEGEGFAEGNEVRFNIKVTNTGNTVLHNIMVTDSLVDATLLEGEGYTIVDGKAEIEAMNPEDVINVAASYVVKAEDVGNAGFKNTVTVKSDETTGEDTTETVPTKGLKVEKSVLNTGSASDGLFARNDIVEFAIKVTNTGTVKVMDIKVTDQLEGTTIVAGDGYVLEDNHATIQNLGVGESVTIKATHTVTEADLRKEIFTNIAVAEFTTPQGPKDEQGTTDIPKVDAQRNWKVVKEVTNLPTRGYFRVDEDAVFKITVTNTGNQTLENIIVADTLSGATLTEKNGYTVNADGTVTIASLDVNASVELEATYKVKSSDVSNGNFKNIAVATVGTEREEGDSGDIPTGSSGGGGGGGGGNSGGPNDNGSTPSGGPGTTTTILPSDVPLAMMPDIGTNGPELLTIDEEEVPLGNLPKTGRTNANGLILLFSSMMLAAYAVVSKKREDEN